MRYTTLGRTALQVSRLCLRTPAKAFDESLMDQALERGVNFFDTAPRRGWQVYGGGTDEIVGRWLAGGGGRRDKVVLAAKVFSPGHGLPHDQGLSARSVIASCERSLHRLRTDWIDLYQMPFADGSASWEEIWQAMEILVQQGKVRYVGSSDHAGWQLVAAQESAARRNFLGLVSEQRVYGLAQRQVEVELVPAAMAYGIGVLALAPLAEDGPAADYREFCHGAGFDPDELALAWRVSRPGVSAAVVGPREVGELDGAIRALDLTITDDVLKKLDELFPPVGNGGPAPEAWAW